MAEAKKDNQVAKEPATDSSLKAKEIKEKAPAAAQGKPAAKAEAKPAAKAEAKAETKSAAKAKGSTRLKQEYDKKIVSYLMKYFKYKNINQVPRLEKIIINMGLGEDKDNAKSIQTALAELTAIAGQKAVLTKAKQSVANFKVREGMTVGAKVTLRGPRMYEFFDKFVSIALPRVRDFRGVSLKSFDGRGNYAMGVKEQLIFPEISYEQVDRVRGFDVCFVTTAKTDEEARELLKALGMPFKAAGGING